MNEEVEPDTVATEADGAIRIRYRVIPKTAPNDLTWLERLLILGRTAKTLPAIPPETHAGRSSPPEPVGGERMSLRLPGH